jgi:phage FluMu protein Com
MTLPGESYHLTHQQTKRTKGYKKRPQAYSRPTPPLGELDRKARKALRSELLKRGCREDELPFPLQDVEVARSKKGKNGQIVVRALSGIVPGPATKLAQKLERDFSQSRDDLLEKLQASGNTSQTIQRLCAILEARPDVSLARAVAEAKADVGLVLEWYAKGALALKKMETVLEIYRQMPHLMRDLARHAIDAEVDCEVCLGQGKVVSRAGAGKLSQSCPRCKGTGKAFSSSEHKQFAVGKLLEMSDLMPKRGGPSVQVNQAVQVNAAQGGELLAKLSKAADEILYGAGTSSSTPVDAELTEESNGGQ